MNSTTEPPRRPAPALVAEAMPDPERSGSRLLARLLILLGAAVITGWFGHWVALTHLAPGMIGMVTITAVDFILLGWALQVRRCVEAGHRRDLLPVALLLLLIAANLVQIAFGVDLGIDLPWLHDWIQDDNLTPGRQALPTSIAFLIAALSLLVMSLVPAPDAQLIRIGRGSAVLLSLIAMAVMAGYALRLELLVNWYLFSKMALHTAIGFLLAAVALWWRWDALAPRRGADARELRSLVSMALMLTALVAAVTAVSVFRNAGEQALDRSVSISRSSMADGVQILLTQSSSRAVILATRPALREGLRKLALRPDDGQALAGVRADLEGFIGYGFSYIALLGADGRALVEVGQPLLRSGLQLMLAGLPGGRAELQAGGDFLLRHHSAVDAGDGRRGILISEQRLPELERILAVGKHLGGGTLSLLCGRSPAIHCADSSGGPVASPEALSKWFSAADSRAASGAEEAPSSWHPVGDTGLLLGLALDRSQLYAPIRHGLIWGFALVAVFTGLGVLLLRSRVDPLMRRLAETEGRYHTVIEALNEGLMLIDATGRVLTANRASGRILGIDMAQVCGRPLLELRLNLFDEHGTLVSAETYPAMRTLMSGVPLSQQRLRNVRPDGSQSWISVDTALVDGGGVVVSFADISEQQRAESESASLEARYQTLVGGIADGVVSIDAHGIVHSYNFAAERIFGRPAEEVIGRNVTLLMPERYRGHHDRNVARFALQQDPSIIGLRRDVVGLRADGREFPMTLALNVVPGSGEARFVALVTDISERKLAERQLFESGRLRQAILDNAPFLIIATDHTGVITTVNPAAERMLWYRADELIGKLPTRLYDHEEVSARAAELSAEIGRPIEADFEVFIHRPRHGIAEEREWTLVRKDGTRFLANMAVTALSNAAGEINGFLGIAYDITERKRREAYTQHVAHHDFLTGLPNRMLLADRLAVAVETARRHHERLAVMMLDLDHFKRVNDSLGHHIGDLLLIEVARRLREALRASDTVARLGGDEFVLLLPDLDGDPATLHRLAEKVVGCLATPIMLHGHELLVTPSVGIAVFPDDGSHGDTLMKNADTALYRVKAQGRNGYRMFSNDMAQAADQRLELEASMRRALKQGEFRLHYQPQVDLLSGQVVGMEALLRWDDPLRGAVAPAVFIPLAEETGLILPLGEWVLRTATREAVDLRARTGLPLRLAVNLSPRQFRQAELLSVVTTSLAASGLPASELELEITEGALMVDTDETQARLKALRAMGVSIAIDDFGVGFSSLSYITRFGIDTLKIDRAFVAALPDSASDAAVTQAVIALAHALDIKVVAEGVENDAQLAFLRARRCDLAQGARFGMATPAAGFSVQGFHFSTALAPDQFVAALPRIAAGSEG